MYLFIEGEWQIIILDDYFSLSGGDFTFCHKEKVLWSMFVEKVYAKINQAYTCVAAGCTKFVRVEHFLRTSKSVSIKLEQNDSIYNFIIPYLNKKMIMVTDWRSFTNHEYTIFQAEKLQCWNKESMGIVWLFRKTSS